MLDRPDSNEEKLTISQACGGMEDDEGKKGIWLTDAGQAERLSVVEWWTLPIRYVQVLRKN